MLGVEQEVGVWQEQQHQEFFTPSGNIIQHPPATFDTTMLDSTPSNAGWDTQPSFGLDTVYPPSFVPAFTNYGSEEMLSDVGFDGDSLALAMMVNAPASEKFVVLYSTGNFAHISLIAGTIGIYMCRV